MRNLLFFIYLFLLVSACGPRYSYEKTHAISDSSWSYSDTLNFEFSIDDTVKLYNLYLEVEHTVDYAHQNLYAKIYTVFPSGVRKDQIISLELADKTGAWQGDCNREKCRFLAPIQANAFFNDPGIYRFTLEQYMRTSPVAGILAVGMKVEETGEKR